MVATALCAYWGDYKPLFAVSAVHKVLAALYVAITMLALAQLERLIGIEKIFLYGGILGAVSAVAFFLLPEPPLPGREKAVEAA